MSTPQTKPASKTKSINPVSATRHSNSLLISMIEVEEITGMGRSFLYGEIAAGRFPKPIKIGPKASRWQRISTENWVADRIAESVQP